MYVDLAEVSSTFDDFLSGETWLRIQFNLVNKMRILFKRHWFKFVEEKSTL